MSKKFTSLQAILNDNKDLHPKIISPNASMRKKHSKAVTSGQKGKSETGGTIINIQNLNVSNNLRPSTGISRHGRTLKNVTN